MKNQLDLRDIGWTDRLSQEAEAVGGGLHPARVSAQHKGLYSVWTEKGELRATVAGKLAYNASAPAAYPVVGDWVLTDRADDADGNAVISRILERKSAVERGAAGTGHSRQVLAANIDTLFLCMSLNRDFNPRRIERYLAIAWDSGATPVIVLTKADLCPDTASLVAQLSAVAAGVDVVLTSAFHEGGETGLRQYLGKGKTAAFLGSSGVGKSTLINTLAGEERQATRRIRENDGRGRHATTHRQLLILPGGGAVIDTPGLREIRVACGDLSKVFSDIEELAGQCRFRDCVHESEPGCAVRRAVDDGSLPEERLESYRKLQKELTFENRRETMTAAQAEKQKIIGMMGSLDARKQITKGNRGKKT